MPNATIEVRTTCPTCGGEPYHWDDCPAHPAWETRFDCDCDRKCPTCNGAGTVLDPAATEKVLAVLRYIAHDDERFLCSGVAYCICGTPENDAGVIAHAPDCPHVLAKAVLA